MKNRYKLPIFSLMALSLCSNMGSSAGTDRANIKESLQLKDIGSSIWTPPMGKNDVVRPSLLHTVFVTAYNDTLALVDPETYASAHRISMAKLKENSLGIATLTLASRRGMSIHGDQVEPVVTIEWEGDEYSAFSRSREYSALSFSKEKDSVLQKDKYMVMNYDKNLHGPMTESYQELVQKYRPMPPMLPMLALKAE